MPPTQTNQPKPQLLVDAIRDFMMQARHMNNNIEITNWLKTGLTDFDEAFGGIRLGAITTVAGRASSGKSSLALNIALNVAISQNSSSLYISLDTPNQQLAERALFQLCDIGGNPLSKHRINLDQNALINRAIQEISDIPLSLIYLPYSDITDICRTIKEFSEGKSTSLVIVDNLDHMDIKTEIHIDTAYAYEIKLLKKLAQELNIAILLISTTNKRGEERENKRPIFSDLPSIEIAKKSDTLLYLYRDEVYNPQGEDCNQSELIVAKDILGRTGAAYLSGHPSINPNSTKGTRELKTSALKVKNLS